MKISKKLSVPDLSGLTLRNATLLLEIMGFVAPEVRYEESYEQAMTVIGQRPERDSVVNSEDPIELIVSQRALTDYLPGVYRSSVYDGAQFIKQFLWIVRHLYDNINDKIDNIPALFSPYTTPPEFLGWLAQWVGFVMDENWTEENKRYLLRRAVDYYRVRGTVKGLKLYLSYFIGVEPEIIENQWPFRGFQIGVRSTMEVDSIIFHAVNKSHCFVVKVPLPLAEVDDQTIIMVHDIIRSEKPAHAMYYLRFEEERAKLTEFEIVIGDEATGYVIGSGREIVDKGEVDMDYIIEEEED